MLPFVLPVMKVAHGALHKQPIFGSNARRRCTHNSGCSGALARVWNTRVEAEHNSSSSQMREQFERSTDAFRARLSSGSMSQVRRREFKWAFRQRDNLILDIGADVTWQVDLVQVEVAGGILVSFEAQVYMPTYMPT